MKIKHPTPHTNLIETLFTLVNVNTYFNNITNLCPQLKLNLYLCSEHAENVYNRGVNTLDILLTSSALTLLAHGNHCQLKKSNRVTVKLIPSNNRIKKSIEIKMR